MMNSIGDIGRIMDERDIPVMSIRRPSEKTKGKWQVSFKETEFRLDWTQGKLCCDFVSALESCLGEKVEVVRVSPTNLANLLND